MRNVFLGILLSFGAPIGALLWRALFEGRRVEADIRENLFFYVYSLVGTGMVFGLFGFVTGLRADRLRRSRDRYQLLADHDGLTHLLNARAFRRHYARQIEEARRLAHPVSLLLLDVDDLKSINDRRGHSVGNAALIAVARNLERNKRVGDLAFRWGGDEFAVLMPGADEDAARRVAQSLLDSLASDSERRLRGLRVAVTIGAASSPPCAEDLLEQADRALYDGKREGGGRVRAARPDLRATV